MPAIAPAAPAIAPAAQGAPAANAPVPFALGPSQALVGVIDFTTKEGQAMFRSNTRCMYSDKTSLFAADAAGLSPPRGGNEPDASRPGPQFVSQAESPNFSAAARGVALPRDVAIRAAPPQ